MSRWTRHIGAAGIMLVGSSAVLTAVLAMNAAEPPRKDKRGGPTTQFTVAKRAKPPAPKPIAHRRPRATKPVRPRAPLPDVTMDVGGLDFGIPALDVAGLADPSDRLLQQSEAIEDMVMTDRAVDVQPRPVEQHAPPYPARARAKGITGYVTVEFVIGREGHVMSVREIEAQPKGVFEDVALQAVKAWRFIPAQYQGKPTKVRRLQTLRFELS